MLIREWQTFHVNEKEILIGLTEVISQSIDQNDSDDLVDKIDILKILPSLDTFSMIYYKSLFTKIIHQRIVNFEMELYFLNKLKFLIDKNSSKRMIDLIKDYKQTAKYSQFITLPKDSQMKLTTNVFTKMEMELSMSCQVKLPPIMNDIISQFEHLYIEEFSSKKFTFIPLYSFCLVSYSFTSQNNDRNRIMLYMNTIQYAILNEFISNENVSIDQLVELTSNKEIIHKMVQLLVDNDIILKNGNELTLNTELQLKQQSESNATGKGKKVINCLVSTQSKINRTEEKKEIIEEDIQSYKMNKTLCTIMKIMKQKKIVLFVDLMNELKEKLSSYFILDTQFIKKNLEYLIDKELIERDSSNPNELKYTHF